MLNIRRLVRTIILQPVRGALPARWRIGYDLLLARLTYRLEDELLHLDCITEGGAVAVDVGANEGFYSYALARRFGTVHAFEPNPRLAEELERHRPPNVQVHTVALSSCHGALDLYVPLVHGVEQHGWASFNRENLPGAGEFHVLHVAVHPLDAFDLEGVAFIKIDVEGHEIEVLDGALQTLQRNRPVVLIEVKERNRETVLALFTSLGYTAWRLSGRELQRLDVWPDRGENVVFRPDVPVAADQVRRAVQTTLSE
jgi:FkbM family methyltransferase